MNSNNAFGFAGLGSVMVVIPTWFPGMVSGAEGLSSVRSIWLMFMGAVMMTIAAIWFGRVAWERVPQWIGQFAQSAKVPAAGAAVARRQVVARSGQRLAA